MGIAFKGEFPVPASPASVMGAFADVPRMAALMPGAFIEGQDDDGAWRGGMLVAFGPKKIRFNGKMTAAFDHAARSGSMVGRGTADMRSARVETRLQFEVKEDLGSAQPRSVVSLSSETVMTGVLAEFARAGGAAVARALMEQFAERLREQLAPPAMAAPAQALAESPSQSIPAAQSTAPASASLRVETLLWSVLLRWLRLLIGRRQT